MISFAIANAGPGGPRTARDTRTPAPILKAEDTFRILGYRCAGITDITCAVGREKS